MTVVLVAIGAVVLALGARLYFAGHRVPTGQPPLAELTNESLHSLRDDFNRSSDGIRIILLLSPT